MSTFFHIIKYSLKTLFYNVFKILAIAYQNLINCLFFFSSFVIIIHKTVTYVLQVIFGSLIITLA